MRSCAANRVPCVAAVPRDDRRQAAADAVAPHADLLLVEAELGGVRDHPARRLPRSRRARPGTDARARAGSRPRRRRTACAGRAPADPVVRLDAADDPAAAVEVDERPARLARLDGTVDPNGHAVGVAILDRVHLVDHGAQLLPHRLDEVRPRLVRRLLLDRRGPGLLQLLHRREDLGVEVGNAHPRQILRSGRKELDRSVERPVDVVHEVRHGDHVEQERVPGRLVDPRPEPRRRRRGRRTRRPTPAARGPSPSPSTRASETADQNGTGWRIGGSCTRARPSGVRRRAVPARVADDDRCRVAPDRVREPARRLRLVDGVERVGRVRREPLVPDERLQRPPDRAGVLHGRRAVRQLERRRELEEIAAPVEADDDLPAEPRARNLGLVAAGATGRERGALPGGDDETSSPSRPDRDCSARRRARARTARPGRSASPSARLSASRASTRAPGGGDGKAGLGRRRDAPALERRRAPWGPGAPSCRRCSAARAPSAAAAPRSRSRPRRRRAPGSQLPRRAVSADACSSEREAGHRARHLRGAGDRRVERVGEVHQVGLRDHERRQALDHRQAVPGDLDQHSVVAEERDHDELREEALLQPLDQAVRAGTPLRLAGTRSPTSGRARAPRGRPRAARRAASVSSSSCAPSVAERSTRPCSSSSRSVASPAAIASSLGANVEPWLNAFSIESNTRSCTERRHHERAHRHIAARERFRNRHEVGLEAPVLEGEQLPGAPEARLHLVDREERRVAAAELLRRREVAVRGQMHALALHRLDEEDGDVLAGAARSPARRGRRAAPG